MGSSGSSIQSDMLPLTHTNPIKRQSAHMTYQSDFLVSGRRTCLAALSENKK
jgi:hypothetical protein